MGWPFNGGDNDIPDDAELDDDVEEVEVDLSDIEKQLQTPENVEVKEPKGIWW